MGATDDGTPNGVVFRFRNIGPVTDAELELGDLTLIAGRNNTGKTYIVYTLYGFLKNWKELPYLHRLTTRRSDEIFRKITARLARTGDASLAMEPRDLDRQRESMMNVLTRYFSHDALAAIFSAPSDAFKGASIEVKLNRGFLGREPHATNLPGSNNAYTISYDGKRIQIIGPQPRSKHSRLLQIRMQLWEPYLTFLFPELRIQPFVLSAERFGISLFYKELDFTKNQIVDFLQRRAYDKDRNADDTYILISEAFSRYALPVKDHIAYTRSISSQIRQKSEIHKRSLFTHIKNIMGGYYKSAGEDFHFVSRSRGKHRFNIPLHRASSSARGLSDFYFFLRHVARKNHLLIVDEPESHLDTSNQIRLARLLVRAVGAGLKVLITTHSDYIIKEINNLIMLSDVGDDVAERLGYEKSDRIDRSRIRAYVAEDNGLTKCRIDRFGIDMPVFDEAIDRINRVANDLASRIPPDADG